MAYHVTSYAHYKRHHSGINATPAILNIPQVKPQAIPQLVEDADTPAYKTYLKLVELLDQSLQWSNGQARTVMAFTDSNGVKWELNVKEWNQELKLRLVCLGNGSNRSWSSTPLTVGHFTYKNQSFESSLNFASYKAWRQNTRQAMPKTRSRVVA